MLSEYNSVEAVGSAMDEAQKSANNWTGSLNQLKNSWTELVNKFVNSDEAVAVIQELNSAIQDLSSSETIKGLGVVTNKIVELVTKLDEYKNKVKDIPVLGKAYDFMSGLANGTTFLKMTSRISDWYNRDAREAEEAARRQEELNKAWAKSTEALEEESLELSNLTAEYAKIYSGADDVAIVKEQLISIQDQLVDKYGDEAKGLDLVSDSLEKNLAALIKIREEKNRQYLEDNKESIENAYESLGIDAYSDSKLSQRIISSGGIDALQKFESNELEALDKEVDDYIVKIREKFKEKYGDLADKLSIDITESDYYGDKQYAFNILEGASADEISQIAQGLKEVNAEILKSGQYEHLNIYDLNDFYADWTSGIQGFYDVIKKSADVQDEIVKLESFRGNTEDYEKFVNLQKESVALSKKLADSNVNVADRAQAGFNLREVESELRALSVKYPEVADLINAELDSISVTFGDTTTNIELATEAWSESLDAAQKGVITNVDKIKSVMEKMYAGEGIDQKSAWEIINLDPNKILSNIRVDENGKYIFDLQEIIRLKDDIIAKEIEERKESVATARANRNRLANDIAVQKKLLSGLDSSTSEYKTLESQIAQNESTMNAYNYTIRNETLLIQYLTKATGDLSDTESMLNAQIKALKAEIDSLTSEMDARLKAQEHVIDGIIDKFKEEQDVLEKRKDALNKQLETLEKQRDTIQETVENYKTVSSYVQDVIQEEIDAIEKERQAVEDAYDARIEKLRAENEEREDALEYEQKLANLNDAKNNKVLSYSSARGWTYETDKEKLKQAENDLASFENEQQIKSLEKERDEALKGFDERIAEKENYAEEWQEVVDGIVEAEQEELAQRILGSEWRDKIAKMDVGTLKKFKTEFNNYNTQLKGSINTEIQNLKDSISAIDDDIQKKQDQVTAWNNYKTQLQKAVSDIKGSLEDYNKYLGTVNLSESSNAQDREANLNTFVSSYSNLATTLNSKQKEYEAATKALNKLADAGERVMKLNLGAALGLGAGSSAQNTVGKAGSSALVTAGAFGSTSISDLIEKLMTSMSEVFKNIFHVLGFSKGGAADYTGLAMIHGSKTHSETVFTSAQSKKLLNLVDALPNFTNFKLNAPKVATKSTTTNIGGSSINIGQMTVVADNPQQFEQQMNRYIQTKLTQSKIY